MEGKNFVVFEVGGKQYFAGIGERVYLDREGLQNISNILFLKKDGEVHIGTPYVKGAEVLLEFIEGKKGKKVISFKKKRRKGYKRKVGHRQKFFVYKIIDMKMIK